MQNRHPGRSGSVPAAGLCYHRPVASVIARAARLARALHPRFARPEDAWAATVLPEPERRVFERMDPRDREHATRVARRLLERYPQASAFAVRAALLHDCGKQVRPYNPFERVIVGLMAPSGPRTAKASARPGLTALEVRNHHPAIGARLIREAGGSERVAEIVERHHTPGGDAEARLIHEVDDLE